MVRTPAEHPWSSYAETGGLREAADWLEVDWTLAQFGSRRDKACIRFRQFVSEGRNASYHPWDELQGRVCLGSERFVQSLAKRVREAAPSPEVPRSQRFLAPRPDLGVVETEVRRAFAATEKDMVPRSPHPARKAFALLARRVADARLAEIAKPLGLSSRSASSVLSAAETLESRDPAFKRQVEASQHHLLHRDCGPNHHSET
jgi:hypothetical protein